MESSAMQGKPFVTSLKRTFRSHAFLLAGLAVVGLGWYLRMPAAPESQGTSRPVNEAAMISDRERAIAAARAAGKTTYTYTTNLTPSLQ
jgi:hypothetical protein